MADAVKEVKKTLESNAELIMQMGSWEESHRLYKSVMRVVSTLSLKNESLINVIGKMAISDEIEEKLWKCMGRCRYKGQRITPALFEDEANREDFLVISKEVLGLNLRPFLKSLSLALPEFPGLLGMGGESPKKEDAEKIG